MSFLRVPETSDGRPWIEVENLILNRDGRNGPPLRMLHLKAPHCLLGPLKRRYDDLGRKVYFADPDMVAEYRQWRDEGNWPVEVRPLLDCGGPDSVGSPHHTISLR